MENNFFFLQLTNKQSSFSYFLFTILSEFTEFSETLCAQLSKIFLEIHCVLIVD